MFQGILSISGQPGLFKLISQSKTGIIVEGIESKKRIPIYSSAKVSSLEDIAIYTNSEEVPLVEVFQKMAKIENFETCSVTKKSSANDLKEYLEDILPEYDKERVYVSDIKKLISWYNILQKNDLLKFDEKEEEKEEVVEENVQEKKA